MRPRLKRKNRRFDVVPADKRAQVIATGTALRDRSASSRSTAYRRSARRGHSQRLARQTAVSRRAAPLLSARWPRLPRPPTTDEPARLAREASSAGAELEPATRAHRRRAQRAKRAGDEARIQHSLKIRRGAGLRRGGVARATVRPRVCMACASCEVALREPARPPRLRSSTERSSSTPTGRGCPWQQPGATAAAQPSATAQVVTPGAYDIH